MSADIVERLHALKESLEEALHGPDCIPEAIATIERLRSGRAAVIEEAAKVVETMEYVYPPSRPIFAAAIRALKDKP